MRPTLLAVAVNALTIGALPAAALRAAYRISPTPAIRISPMQRAQ